MGVNAVVYVAIPKEMTDREILRASYELCEAFGPDKFMLNRKHEYSTRNEHALIRYNDNAAAYTLKPEPNVNHTVLRVRLWSRYYGPGYERGDFPFLYALARYMERKYFATVYYGGDVGDSIELWDSDGQEEFLEHFSKFGHSPYRTYSFQPEEHHFGHPFCEYCQEPMNRFGWGRSYASYTCLGCGWQQVTQDSGVTWTEERQR